MSVEVQFVGGPADGKQIVLDGDPMNPRLTTEVLQPSPLNWHELDAGVVPPIRKVLYRREASASDDGPLWLYRYDERASAGPARPGEEPTT
ncbi:hypothetical protein [Streptomyces scabiei]|uniref:hypothetical protein n=1 Tax=Streptomyces scabiei TaxID=1930 RepID=UPI000765FB61|nr:hypothetical protein [Streptomyces scabiei]